MMKKNTYGAFTLIEIVVSATILVILTTIGFYSYTKNISDARDGRRQTDITSLSSQLNLYQKQRGAYPVPGNNFEIRNRGYVVAYQGLMNQSVVLSTAEKLPVDPELNIPYIYSVTRNKQQYQLALTLENNESPKAVLVGSYKSVARNVLPNIILASNSTIAMEINAALPAGVINRKLFVFDNGFHNIPYDFETGLAKSDNTELSILIQDAGKDYWQNSDYRTCSDIILAAKIITPSGQSDEYQVLSSTGVLTNTGCLAP